MVVQRLPAIPSSGLDVCELGLEFPPPPGNSPFLGEMAGAVGNGFGDISLDITSSDKKALA